MIKELIIEEKSLFGGRQKQDDGVLAAEAERKTVYVYPLQSS